MDAPSSSLLGSVALASLLAFVSGSLPFSSWIARLLAGRDLREFGDGNPGATNAFRAGGLALGIPVLLLDVTKGVLPVVFAEAALGLSGGALALVAALPVAGAAFSPFLGFCGGKGLAVTLGTWIGLTTWTIPLVAVVAILVATLLIEPDAWAVALALAAMLVGVALVAPGWLLLAWLLQAVVILWKHRNELTQAPRRRRVRARAPA